MINIVISYAHTNRDWCEALVQQLCGLDGVSIWFDYRNQADRKWDEAFLHRMEAADLVLLLISPDYVNSKVCRAETALAHRLQAARKVRIIPVLVRKCIFDVLRLDAPNPSPVGGNPLEEWPSRDDAAMAVARDVKNALAERGLVRGRAETFSIDSIKIQTGLHFYCARISQKSALDQSLDKAAQRPRRPFVVVLGGHESESIDWYVRRLQCALLQDYFKPSNPQQLTPVQWTAPMPGQSPFDTFRSQLRGAFGCLPQASMRDMNAALKNKNKVAVLQSRVSADTWGGSTGATFDAYLQLWNEWPDLPEGHRLIVVIAIAYRNPKVVGLSGLLRRVGISRVRKPKVEGFPGLPSAAAEYLRKLHIMNWPELEGVVLDELPNIQHEEFTNWLTANQEQNCLPDQARVLNRIPNFNFGFPCCMHEVSTSGLDDFLKGL